MNFTTEFFADNVDFINRNTDLLANITSEDLDTFVIFDALADYYDNILGFSSGGTLHVVIEDHNLEREHIENCKQDCIVIHDIVGINICEALLNLEEETRFFMVENRWFFRQYVLAIYSRELSNRLTEHFRPKKVEPELPNGSIGVMQSMNTVEVLLKESQESQAPASYFGTELWNCTFKGEPILIPSRTFRFSYPKGDRIEDYIEVNELQSICFISLYE